MNAFWNPYYYHPRRRTLTKKLLFISEKQLLDEVRSLIYLSLVSNRSLILPNVLGEDLIGTVDYFRGLALWPGFRLLFSKSNQHNNVDIIEPAYYWRLRHDYDYGELIPTASVVTYSSQMTMSQLEGALLSEAYHSDLRIILHDGKGDVKNLTMWADDSVGAYSSYFSEVQNYEQLMTTRKSVGGPIRGNLAYNIIDSTRLCLDIFGKMKGNRSCFDKCD